MRNTLFAVVVLLLVVWAASCTHDKNQSVVLNNTTKTDTTKITSPDCDDECIIKDTVK